MQLKQKQVSKGSAKVKLLVLNKIKDKNEIYLNIRKKNYFKYYCIKQLI